MHLVFRAAAAPAPPPRRRPQARGLVGAVLGSATLLLAAVGPISAGPPAKASGWSDSAPRVQTTRHIASVREAAKLAVGQPRAAAKPRPLRGVKIDSSAVDPARLPRAAALTAGGSDVAAEPVTGPPVEVLQQFAGQTASEGGGWDRPAPWIAVNATYVVQSVNAMIRVSNRSGVAITSIAPWTLFAVAAGQNVYDARIIWDATHNRWVASSVSSNAAETSNYLHLAVSDGADPTAGWRVFSQSFGASLPDYPSLASSSDKVVVTDNLFDAGQAPVGADIHTWTWASSRSRMAVRNPG